MKNHHRLRSHTYDRAAERSLPESRRAGAAHVHPQRISDGVVAGYIHDISVRHSSSQAEPYVRRPRGALG